MTIGKVILWCILSFMFGGLVGIFTMCLMITAGRDRRDYE